MSRPKRGVIRTLAPILSIWFEIKEVGSESILPDLTFLAHRLPNLDGKPGTSSHQEQVRVVLSDDLPYSSQGVPILEFPPIRSERVSAAYHTLRKNDSPILKTT